MTSILLAIWVVSSTTATGAMLLASLSLTWTNGVQRFVFAACLGLGAWLLLLFWTGTIIAYTPVMALGITLLFTLPVLFVAKSWLRSVSSSWKTFAWDRMTWTLMGLCVACTALAMASSFAPVADMADALAYHLNLPKEWIREGKIKGIPYDFNSAFPMLMGVGYGVGLMFQSPAFANLLAVWIGVLGALSVYGWARQRTSPKYAWLGAAAFLLTPAVYNHFNVPYADLALALFTLLGIWSFCEWVRDGKSAWIGLSGVFCGMALGVKYLAMVGTFLVAFAICWEAVSKRMGIRKTFLLLFLFGVFVLGGSFMWYLRSYLQMGNPVYPFLSGLFGGQSSPVAFEMADRTYGVGYDLRHLLTIFWDATLAPEAYAGFGTRWNLLFLGFFPLVVWFVVRERGGWPAFFVLVILLSWFYLSQIMRFLMPFFPLYCVLLAWSAQPLDRFPRMLQRLLWTWILAVCLWETACLAAHALPKIRAASSRQASEEFLLRREPTYGMARWVNENLPADVRIVSDAEVRFFYFKPRMVREGGMVLFSAYRQRMSSPTSAIAFLKEQGVTHALVLERVGTTSEASAPATEYSGVLRQLVKDGSSFGLLHETSADYAGGKFVYKLYALR